MLQCTGFYISAGQLNNPMIKIIEAIDGPDVFKACGLGLKKCSSTHPCPIHDVFKEIRDRFESMYRSNTLNDLCGPMNIGLTYLTV